MRRSALVATATGLGAAAVVAGVLAFSGESDPPAPSNPSNSSKAVEATRATGQPDPATAERFAEAAAQWNEELKKLEEEKASVVQRVGDEIADATP